MYNKCKMGLFNPQSGEEQAHLIMLRGGRGFAGKFARGGREPERFSGTRKDFESGEKGITRSVRSFVGRAP